MKKSISLIVVMTVLFLPGCKKYPEGPLISFYSATNRIVGRWDYKHIYENDIDLAYLVHCDTCFFTGISFYSDEVGDYFSTLQSYSGGTFGNWSLSEKQKYIIFDYEYANNPPIGPLFNESAENKWRIKRLTKKEFWLTCDYNGKHYEINLKK